MGLAEGPSRWAVEQFGTEAAAELWKRVPEALARAVERSMDAHEASKMTSKHAFGTVRWLVQYEEMVIHLDGLPGMVAIHPRGAQFRIVLYAGHLLLPWYYSETGDVSMRHVRPDRSFHQLIRDLLNLFGPKPRYEQHTLPEMPTHLREQRELTELREQVEKYSAEPEVLLIGYACNPTAGLLRVSWGRAALDRDNSLHWEYDEDLPLPSPQTG